MGLDVGVMNVVCLAPHAHTHPTDQLFHIRFQMLGVICNEVNPALCDIFVLKLTVKDKRCYVKSGILLFSVEPALPNEEKKNSKHCRL